jgi:hypothetical protein
LIHKGAFAESEEWQKIRQDILDAIQKVENPRGSGKFSIYPESGKKSGMGNGVKPIKDGMMEHLESQGWVLESPFTQVGEVEKREVSLRLPKGARPGDFDGVLVTPHGPVAVEWETGNISSSHRAVNKMALGLLKGSLAAGILIVPTSAFAYFLTDRIGNYRELEPYLDLWRSIPVDAGILEIIAIEHDDESTDVPKIPKGTDGRARL